MTRSVARRTAVRLGLPVLALGLAASMTAAPASAAPVAPADETAILMNFVVNSDAGAAAATDVKAAVKAAGGKVLSQYKDIGVTVAQSDKANFASTLRNQDDLIDSVGATRTSAVGAPMAPKADEYGPFQRVQLEPDPREGEQWGNTKLQSLAANEIEDGKKSVVVGIVDSGVDDTHPDLSANFNRAASVDCVSKDGVPNTAENAWRPTSSTHGTHVAGTVAAARNGVGVAGIAPGAQYSAIKVVNDDGFIFPEYALCGFQWAVDKGVEVTNSSFYVDPWLFWCANDPDQSAVQDAFTKMFKYTDKKGVINVAAAGNASYDLANKTTDTTSPNDSTPITRPVNKNCLEIPGEHKGVITVSATTQAGPMASFSNYGLGVIDVAAPGANILSTTWPGGTYASFSGTSMASPHVAGVIALMESVKPGLSTKKMTKQLYKDSVDTACPAGVPQCEGTKANNGYFGRGVVNALNAVK